jgi:hypothetical protein
MFDLPENPYFYGWTAFVQPDEGKSPAKENEAYDYDQERQNFAAGTSASFPTVQLQ